MQISDTLFTWSDLQAKQNNELLKNLGNFVHRCLSFVAKPSGKFCISNLSLHLYFILGVTSYMFFPGWSLTGEGYGGVIPEQKGSEKHQLTTELISKIEENVLQYIDAMEKVAQFFL